MALAGRVSADVPLPGTQPEDFQDQKADPRYAPFSPSRACKPCHGEFATENYEAHDTWKGSAMGNAARDPLFLAALSIADADSPGSGDFCIRCHAPEAWLEGRSDPSDGSALLADDDGVTCHFCHRLVVEDPDGLDADAPYVGNARFFVAREAMMRGPYDDVTTAPHETTQSAYHSEAIFCGLCHDVSNPLVPWRDADGTELGSTFPLQRTYTEWLRSAFASEAATCQSCHMPAFSGTACNVAGTPPRDDVFTHALDGANTWLPDVLTLLYDDDLDRADAWAVAKETAIAMLQSSASLAFETLGDSAAAGSDLAFEVRVTNLSGHKLPTGYAEGRRMWLEVVVTDAGGRILFESGRWDETTGDRLEDEQLRVYEAAHGIAGQGPGSHFVLNDTIVSDTRIPPRGFQPEESDGVTPVGRDYGDGAGGYRDFDIAPYVSPVPCGAAEPITVRVRLLQQSVAREYVEFLRDEQESVLGLERARTLYDAWDQTGGSAPVVVKEITEQVPLADSCVPDAGPDGGTGGGEDGCCAVAPGAHDGEGWVTFVVFGVMITVRAAGARRRRNG